MTKEEAYSMFQEETSLFERFGATSIITFSEWLDIKNIPINNSRENGKNTEREYQIYKSF